MRLGSTDAGGMQARAALRANLPLRLSHGVEQKVSAYGRPLGRGLKQNGGGSVLDLKSTFIILSYPSDAWFQLACRQLLASDKANVGSPVDRLKAQPWLLETGYGA